MNGWTRPVKFAFDKKQKKNRHLTRYTIPYKEFQGKSGLVIIRHSCWVQVQDLVSKETWSQEGNFLVRLTFVNETCGGSRRQP